ncbi:MAG: FAD-dependent oxidoreductase [Gloeomargarita sp. SKYBB_i_bin120]|nr:FAD-binding oxidoreductase [Gloeomargarita sp. SKYG98]MCS7291645.1 FAD-binding oxidoreductase [Gloeomargarita sp. SKYB120]MDW8177204.1 FAD-dependent oxidoreductase [Gloeomargarita sp. SKYBB_i_bin120]
MRIAIIGAGVVGAAIAWELSHISGWDITVYEARSAPAQGATAAALGLLMAVLSDRGTAKRLASLQRYHEILKDSNLPSNRRGLLRLYDDAQTWAKVMKMVERRRAQGWSLEVLTPADLQARFPVVHPTGWVGAVWSPQEWQFQPVPLTQHWLQTAQARGVQVSYDTPVVQVIPERPWRLVLPQAERTCDVLVVSAGLGSTQIPGLTAPFRLEPVLGQAVAVSCPELADYPVIYGRDTAIVPQAAGVVWVGATVESRTTPDPATWEQLWQTAVAICPVLQGQPWQQQWHGLRPHPVGHAAPIVQVDPHHPHLIWATGHYRNGVLLAPWTAQQVRRIITGLVGSNHG